MHPTLKLHVVDLIGSFLKLFQITFMLNQDFLFVWLYQKLFCEYLLKILVFRILLELAHELDILE
jgi:hypothetical protein